MFDVSSLGKALVLCGIVLALAGLVMVFGARIPWLGRLPGDIYIQKKNLSFYFPIATSLLISLVLSLALFFLRRR